MLSTFLYRKGKPLEMNISRAQMLAAFAEKDCVFWVDIENATEFESDSLVEIFNFHPLAVEDCVTDISQPKMDDYEEYLFLVLHSLSIKPDTVELEITELDIFLGKNYVVTFHRNPVRSVQKVREMAAKKPDVYLGHGTDLLVHNILDNLVDNYMPVIDCYDDRIDQMEEEIFKNPSPDYLSTVMHLKRDIFNLRRVVAPQRDTINYITRTPTPFIKPKNMIYFRDVYDHLFRVYGIIEGFHEVLAGILQAYFSYSSHRLNEIMKRMTVLATLTMPSIIIASIYGMNFSHMPELGWKYGYLMSIGLMGATSVVMLIWMKFKKWI